MSLIRKIVLVVDNPVRDLPAQIILGNELIEKGAEVYIAPFYGIGGFLQQINPHIVVLNYARPNNAKLIEKLHSQEVTVCVLDTEGGVFSNTGNDNSFIKTLISDREVRNKVSRYYVWGEKLYNYLLNENIYSSEQLELTGTPRFDAYSDKYNGILNRENKLKDYILVTGSFPVVNSQFQPVEVEARMLVEKFNYEQSYVDNLVEKLTSGLNSYVEKIIELAKEFPGTDIVYRPHPFENVDFYNDKFKSVSNVHVIKQGVIAEWIHDSIALIHFESSCALDATILNRPCLAFDFSKEAFDIPDISAITHRLDNNWLSVIKNCIEGSYDSPKEVKESQSHILRQIIYKNDGQAAKRISESLMRLAISEYKSANKLLVERVKPLIKNLLGKYDLSKSFSSREVTEIIDKLQISNIQTSSHFQLGKFSAIELKTQ